MSNEEARLNGEILDQDIENAYEHFTNDLGYTPTVDDVIDNMFSNNPDYEEYWGQTPEDTTRFYNEIKSGLRYLGLEVEEDFTEAQLSSKDLQYLNSLINRSVSADTAKQLALSYLANVYGPKEVGGNLGAEAINIINMRFKESLVSTLDQKAQDTVINSDNLRAGKEELIKQKLNLEKDTDLSKIDDDTLETLAGTDGNKDNKENLVSEISDKLGLEDEDALKDMKDEDLDQMVGLVGNLLGGKQEESLKVDKDGNLLQETVQNVLEYYNEMNSSDVDLAFALKEHCGLTKNEAREIIQSRYIEAQRFEENKNLDQLVEFAKKIKEAKTSKETIHAAFEEEEPVATAITCSSTATSESKEEAEPKDLHADNPLADIVGQKITEGAIAQELGNALKDIRIAKEVNQNYEVDKTDKALKQAEQSVELAKIDAVQQDV